MTADRNAFECHYQSCTTTLHFKFFGLLSRSAKYINGIPIITKAAEIWRSPNLNRKNCRVVTYAANHTPRISHSLLLFFSFSVFGLAACQYSCNERKNSSDKA